LDTDNAILTDLNLTV